MANGTNNTNGWSRHERGCFGNDVVDLVPDNEAGTQRKMGRGRISAAREYIGGVSGEIKNVLKAGRGEGRKAAPREYLLIVEAKMSASRA